MLPWGKENDLILRRGRRGGGGGIHLEKSLKVKTKLSFYSFFFLLLLTSLEPWVKLGNKMLPSFHFLSFLPVAKSTGLGMQ